MGANNDTDDGRASTEGTEVQPLGQIFRTDSSNHVQPLAQESSLQEEQSTHVLPNVLEGRNSEYSVVLAEEGMSVPVGVELQEGSRVSASVQIRDETLLGMVRPAGGQDHTTGSDESQGGADDGLSDVSVQPGGVSSESERRGRDEASSRGNSDVPASDAVLPGMLQCAGLGIVNRSANDIGLPGASGKIAHED